MFKQILNKFKQRPQTKAAKEQSDRIKFLEPVVRDAIKIMFAGDYPLGDYRWEDGIKQIKPIARDLLNLYNDYNIKLTDLDLMQQMINRLLTDIHNAVLDTVNHNVEFVDKEIWGCYKREIDFHNLGSMIETINADREQTEIDKTAENLKEKE